MAPSTGHKHPHPTHKAAHSALTQPPECVHPVPWESGSLGVLTDCFFQLESSSIFFINISDYCENFQQTIASKITPLTSHLHLFPLLRDTVVNGLPCIVPDFWM